MIKMLLVVVFSVSKPAHMPHFQSADDVVKQAIHVTADNILSFGDSLYGFNAQAATGDNQILGVEFIDGVFWLSGGNSFNNPNKLYKLDVNGNLIGVFDQPTQSTWGFRDMTFDGDYLYGSDDDGTIYQIDPSTGSPTGTAIPGPLSINRALAYDPAHDKFWTANFNSMIYEFDRDGTVINTYPNSHAIYGMAWDDVSPGGPWLWVATQDLSNGYYNVIYQFDPRTGSFTDSAIVVTYGFPGGHAGGLSFTADLLPGKAVLVEVIQETDATSPNNDIVVAIEVADFGSYLTPMPPTEITAYSDYTMPNSMIIRWNDPTHYVNGTRLRNFQIEVFSEDSTLLATVPEGVESTIIDGLTDGVQYQFMLQTVDSLGRRSVIVPSPWWYAGGSPWPAPPTDVAWHYVNDSTVLITWNDPTTQSDGTPLDDLLGIYIYLDDTLRDSTYAGFERKVLNVVPGPHSVYLRAFDAEPERHLSVPSDTIWIFTTGHRVGPDDFGYHLIDSYIEDSLQFSWVEISDIGTRLNLDDDDLAEVQLPFTLPFYDTMFTTIYVNSNGGITFSLADTLPPENLPIPSIGIPTSILPLWTDLNPVYANNGGVFVAQHGNDFIVEWKNVPLYGSDATFTFEVIVHPNGWLEYQYLSIPEDQNQNYTVGVFRSTGSFYFLQYTYNGDPIQVTDSLAVEVIRPPFHDVGIGMIQPSDTSLWPGVPVTPLVSVVNFSENPESVAVSLSISRNGVPVYSDTSVIYVEPYASSNADFAYWVPSPVFQGVDYQLIACLLETDSNSVNDTLAATVHVTTVEHDSLSIPLAITVPTIDGLIGSAEWSDALQVDISSTGSGNVLLYLKHDGENIYMAVDAPADTTVNATDRFEFLVDDNGDYLWPEAESDTSEGGNAISVAWQWATRPMTFDRFYDWEYPRNDMSGRFFISLNSGHFQAELSVPLYLSEPDPAHITPSADSTFNIMFAYIDNGSIVGLWPHFSGFEQMDYPIFYGHAKLMAYNPEISESEVTPRRWNVKVLSSPSPVPTLLIKSPSNSYAELDVVDASGRTVKSFSKSLEKGENSVKLPVLKPGVYFVQVKTAHHRETVKVMVVR